MKVRDSLYIDFNYECDNVDFNDKEACDKSYQLMNDQLHIQFEDKEKTDKSLTKKDIAYIVDVLNNTELELRDAYIIIYEFLREKKCIATRSQRHKYFYKRANNDLGIYLMRAIEQLHECSKRDYMEIAADIGMCNSESLDFFDAYNDENGWTVEVLND